MPSAEPMPPRLDLAGGYVLERATAAHAAAVALAVTESREHLRPFLPFAADDGNTRAATQHARLVGVERLWEEGREYQYTVRLADPDDDRVLGMISAMHTDRWGVGRDAVELGYWVHVDWCNRGLATGASQAVAAASLAMPGVERIVIVCDADNAPSNAVPRKLGYTMERTIERPPAAPSESGRMQVWVGGPTTRATRRGTTRRRTTRRGTGRGT